MSTQFTNFHPSIWQVRVEVTVDKGYPCPWRNAASVINCYSWKEAFDESIRQANEWEDAIQANCEHYIRFNRTAPGGWVVEVIDAQAICPKKIRVDCEVYVGGDPLGDDDELTWYVASYRLVEEFGEPEPEPEPEQYQPEDLIIPIPTWEWVETEPETFVNWGLLNSLAEPEPEPEQHQPEPDQDWEPTLITRGYLRVTVETHDKLVEGNKAFNLPYHRADAVWQAGVYTSEIRDRITELIGFQPESQAFNKSPYWDMPDQDRGNWCEWICTWRADFYQGLERVTFEWGFDHDQPPFEAEEKEDSTEPLWLGCITVEQPKGKRSTCQASNHRFVISEWLKGGVETYALMTDYCGLDSEHIVGKHSLTDISRDGQSYRDINITIGDLVGEGIRLL